MQQLTELQEKWLKALESGEYRQGKSYLRSSEGAYCCLGVLVVVSGRTFTEQGYCEGRSQVLPTSVEKEVRLRDYAGETAVPFFIGDRWFTQLTEANDAGRPFSEIAAAIRANPENFFLPPEAP